MALATALATLPLTGAAARYAQYPEHDNDPQSAIPRPTGEDLTR